MVPKRKKLFSMSKEKLFEDLKNALPSWFALKAAALDAINKHEYIQRCSCNVTRFSNVQMFHYCSEK